MQYYLLFLAICHSIETPVTKEILLKYIQQAQHRQ